MGRALRKRIEVWCRMMLARICPRPRLQEQRIRSHGWHVLLLGLLTAAGGSLAAADAVYEVSVSATIPKVIEGDGGSAIFTISRTGSGQPLAINYTLTSTETTATMGVDYNTSPNAGQTTSTLIFGEAETSITLQVTPIDDSITEGAEFVAFTILQDSNLDDGPGNVAEYVVKQAAGAATSIIKDDEVEVTVNAQDTLMGETTGNTASFFLTITRSGIPPVGGWPTAEFPVELKGTATPQADNGTSGVDYNCLAIPWPDATNANPWPNDGTFPHGFIVNDAWFEAETFNVAAAGNVPVIQLYLFGAHFEENNPTEIDEADLAMVGIDSGSSTTAIRTNKGVRTIGSTVTIEGNNLTVVWSADSFPISSSRFVRSIGTVDYYWYLGTEVLETVDLTDGELEITVVPLDLWVDTTPEGAETVEIGLVESNDVLVRDPDFGVAIIEDDDLKASITLLSHAGEPSVEGSARIQLSSPVAQDIPVPFSVAGSATPNTDFSISGTGVSFDSDTNIGTATIPAGETTTTVLVIPEDDSIDEESETVRMAVQPSFHYRIQGLAESVVNILDKVGTVSIDTATASVDEPTGASTTVQFRLTLDGGMASVAPDRDFEVLYSVSGTATAGLDYDALSGSVIFEDTDTSATIDVDLLDDALAEGDETIVITLAAGSGYTINPDMNEQVMTIQDNEPVVQIVKNSDPAEPSTQGTYTVSFASGDPGRDIQVTYEINTESTAESGSDYTPLTGTVTIGSSGSATITVTPTDDGIVEDPETIIVDLVEDPEGNGAPNYFVDESAGSATMTISDDEPTIVVSWVDDAVEGVRSGHFQISAAAAVSRDVIVSYSLGGTALAGTDYTDPGVNATIASGSTSVQVEIATLDDAADEEDETVTITLNSSSAYTLGATTTSELTIVDNEGGAVAISNEPDEMAIVDGSTTVHTVLLTVPDFVTSSEVTVALENANGSSTLPAWVSIGAASVSSGTVQLPVTLAPPASTTGHARFRIRFTVDLGGGSSVDAIQDLTFIVVDASSTS